MGRHKIGYGKWGRGQLRGVNLSTEELSRFIYRIIVVHQRQAFLNIPILFGIDFS